MVLTCFECGTERPEEEMVILEVYDRPFDDLPRKIAICREEDGSESLCQERLFDTGWADFRYSYCSSCERAICRQNPSNGWHGQFRVLDGEEVCLKCYERILLEDGVSREALEDGRLPGMFFSFGNPELLEAGYVPIKENVFIGGESTALALTHLALELIDQGSKVVIAYERLALGGLEGTVSLYAKEPHVQEVKQQR